MPVQKQSLNIPFALGLDTKTDQYQVAPGNFIALENTIFTKGKQLTKRNGFAPLTALPVDSEASTLTTFQGNLTAIGNQVFAYSQASDQWEARGRIQPIQKSVQSLVRSTYSQAAPDIAISDNGLACVVFLDGDGNYKYQISDYSTGQTLIGITNLPAGANVPRTFVLGRSFVITFLITVTATPHLQYIAIPINNLNAPVGPVNLSSLVKSTSTSGYDGVVSNNNLYIAFESTDGGGAVRVTYLDSTLTQHTTVVLAGHQASLMSVTVDSSGNTPVIWVTAYKSNDAYSTALNQSLTVILAATHTIIATTISALTSVATNTLLTLLYEIPHNYSYESVASDFISRNTCTQAGVVGSPVVMARSVGLASEAFFVGDTIYVLSAYGGQFQPTYFLLDSLGNTIAKLAYSNGAGYSTTQVLPSVTVTGNVVQMAYLLKDLIQSVNKSQTAPSVNGIYSQTGVNLASFNFSSTNLSTGEIGNNLIISGGITWLYDGVKPVELGFNVWPEDILATPDTSGGSMPAQTYFYQITYEWTDGQGNIHRSAPSIPVKAILGGTGEVTLNIPTLRLTYKTTPNAVRIVIYRWSTAQQNYYQVTSISSPVLNDPTVDSITYLDTQADTAIIGNNLIYTTGGVVENIAPPGTSIISLFNDRLFLVDDEDPNLMWYSKQVIEATPVEMSDLFTIFVAPTSGAQGSTGILTALSPMDDKLCMFKKNAIYYMTGIGPDNTGSQNDFSNPIFITATVGCTNQQSIVFIPEGLPFQSDKGIWILSRNLSTQYLGAPVEVYNNDVVFSSAVIPGTNQVRFTLQTGTSSTLYKDTHTILNEDGVVLQETPNAYLDGNLGIMLMYDYYYGQWGTFNIDSSAVTIKLTTAWLNLAGVQGFERAYFFYLLGTFISPHKLQLYIAYDYNPSPSQSLLISPINYSQPYAEDPLYAATTPYAGPGDVEQWRVFLKKQKCQSFQITLQEVFDNSQGTIPGAGLTLSGINLVVGAKSQYPRLKAAVQVS